MIRKELKQKIYTHDWLPITEAPKQITRILAYNGNIIEVIEWGENWCSHGRYIPTHFMLLPAPPKEGK